MRNPEATQGLAEGQHTEQSSLLADVDEFYRARGKRVRNFGVLGVMGWSVAVRVAG